MKKKWLAMMLVVVCAVSLAACGSSSTESGEGAADTQVSGDSGTEGTEDEDTGQELELTFESLTVVDNEECSIVITGIDEDNIWGYALEVELENKSADKTYMYAVQSAAINGVQTDPFYAEEVAAGKKSLDEIYFDADELAEYGVDTVTDIEISMHVYDSDDWTADDVAEVTVHVYPYGEENAVTFERESQETDNVLVDNDYVTVIVTGYEMDSIWGYTVNVYLVNKTDSEVMFSVDDASVNGYMADPIWAESVSAGKCAFDSIYWYDSTLEEIGITDPENEIETIEFSLRAYNNEDWSADDYVEQTVTLNP